jgi:hypothetical protein
MKRRDIPGGWYCDALPGGYYAALVRGSHIETPHGNLELPEGQDALFLRIGMPGPVLGCCGARDDRAWFRTSHWQPVGPVYGIHAVIFDHNGLLLTVPGPSHPAAPQGFRQIADDGRVLFVRDTYTQQYPYEWTTHGDLTIGQGDHGPLGEDPCIAKMPDGSFRLVEPGRCRMIRFHREGDRLAIAMVREDIVASVICWLTVAELDALPRFTRPGQAMPVCDIVYRRGDAGACPRCGHPKSNHTLEEPDEPEAPEEHVSIPDHFHVVRAINDAHPQLLQKNDHDSVKEFYWRAAWALHQSDPKFGFLSKSPGEAHQVIEGQRVANDAVAYRDAAECVDIIVDVHGDGPAKPAWQVVPRRSTNTWVQPPAFRGGGGGGGAGTGGSATTGVTSAEVDKLRNIIQDLAAEVGALKERVAALEDAALHYGSPVILRTDSGHVVCAEGGGGGVINAARTNAGAWETFVVEKP